MLLVGGKGDLELKTSFPLRRSLGKNPSATEKGTSGPTVRVADPIVCLHPSKEPARLRCRCTTR